MKKVSVFLGLILASGLTIAQQPGFYAGASWGRTSVDDDATNLDSELRAFGVTNISTHQDDSDTTWKVYGGYQFSPYLGVEGGYAHLGEYKATLSGNYLGNALRGHGTVKAHAVFADAVGHIPFMDNRLSLFGKAGLAYTKTELDASANVAGFSSSTDENHYKFVPKLGVGIRYNLTEQFGVRAEYERYFGVGDEDTTGKSDVDAWSVGLVLHF